MHRTSLRATFLVGLTLALVAGCARKGTRSPEPRQAMASEEEASTVRSAEMDRQPNEAIEKALEGKIAGVTVSRTPDGGIAVRIRGATSGYNAEPLYVVDGMAIQPGPNGALTGINPSDIESIRVLKSAAETAMYGARGANGVIIIKTKRPKP